MAAPDELEQLAQAYYKSQAAVARTSAEAAEQLWASGINVASLLASYANVVGPGVTTVIQSARLLAAQRAATYVADAAAAWGLDEAPLAEVNPEGFTLDAAAIDGVCLQAPVDALAALAQGKPFDEALDRGRATLVRNAATLASDAGLDAAGAGIAARPGLGGYYRKLVVPSCGRCAVQAGKWFRWNEGFLRHPLCDCIHVPAADADDSLAFDPEAYFRSLSAAEQERLFGKARAEKIRAGANLGRVVNARSGMRTPGVAAAATPTQIFRDATSRDDAVRRLRTHGYFTR